MRNGEKFANDVKKSISCTMVFLQLQTGGHERTRHRQMTWTEMCRKDAAAHFGFTTLVPEGSFDYSCFPLMWRMTLDFVLGHLCFGPWVIAFWRGTWGMVVFYTEKEAKVQTSNIIFRENATSIKYNSFQHNELQANCTIPHVTIICVSTMVTIILRGKYKQNLCAPEDDAYIN